MDYATDDAYLQQEVRTESETHIQRGRGSSLRLTCLRISGARPQLGGLKDWCIQIFGWSLRGGFCYSAYIKNNTSEHNILFNEWSKIDRQYGLRISKRRNDGDIVQEYKIDVQGGFRDYDYDPTTLSPLITERVPVPEAADVLPGSLRYYLVELRAIKLVSVSKRLDGAGQGA